MDDYRVLEADGHKFFLTHGHLYNAWSLPPAGTGDILCHGHTHVAEDRMLECGMRLFNPGSVSLPKGGQQRQFGYWDGADFRHFAV